ncbi:MAG TPA: hypothetical protein VG276_28705 [Actinomycetes bacterium]|jgi:hypothetical protein|nr:hypothetical protein [Actinomycetes bacterium]
MASSPKDFAAGAVLTAAQMDSLPQGVFAVATATADVGPTSGTTELDVVTASAVVLLAANRRLKLTFAWRGLSGATSGDVYTLRIKEGATVLMESTQAPSGALGQLGGTMVRHLPSPTAASHTYKATIQRAAGTGTVSVQGNANYPIQLIVEDGGEA